MTMFYGIQSRGYSLSNSNLMMLHVTLGTSFVARAVVMDNIGPKVVKEAVLSSLINTII